LAPSDMIFPQPRLGFVDTQRSGTAQRCAVVFGRQALLVKAVAGFVENAKEGLCEILLVVARGQAAVRRSVGAAKWMCGGINAPRVEVKADCRGHFVVKRLLGRNRIISAQKT